VAAPPILKGPVLRLLTYAEAGRIGFDSLTWWPRFTHILKLLPIAEASL